MDLKTLRLIQAICTCPCWCQYYGWLHNTIRTWKMCMEIADGTKNMVMKILFLCLMAFCCFQLVSCVFWCVSWVHVFKDPCNAFRGDADCMTAYHAIVFEQSCDLEPKIKGAFQKVFK